MRHIIFLQTTRSNYAFAARTNRGGSTPVRPNGLRGCFSTENEVSRYRQQI